MAMPWTHAPQRVPKLIIRSSSSRPPSVKWSALSECDFWRRTPPPRPPQTQHTYCSPAFRRFRTNDHKPPFSILSPDLLQDVSHKKRKTDPQKEILLLAPFCGHLSHPPSPPTQRPSCSPAYRRFRTNRILFCVIWRLRHSSFLNPPPPPPAHSPPRPSSAGNNHNPPHTPSPSHPQCAAPLSPATE